MSIANDEQANVQVQSSRIRRRKRSRDTLLLPLILLIFLGSCVFGTVRSLLPQPSTAPSPGTEFGVLDDYPPGAVVYYQQSKLYIVRLRKPENEPNQGLLALSDRDPGSNCLIAHYPNEIAPRTDGTVQMGVFKDTCQGRLYSLDGMSLNASTQAISMRRFPVRLAGSTIYVELPVN